MYNAHPRYMCYPSVVCVGKETEVSIFPRDISRRFRGEKEYELAVVGLWEDQLDYHDHILLDYPCSVKNGCLIFKCKFEREQEYSIRFCEKGGKEIKVPLYAVEEDLYTRRPLKGDLHTHTWYSDGSDGIAMTPADYREEGFDFVSITDHNRMFPSKLAADLYKDIPLGLHIMSGEEVHTPGSQVHIVHVGGKQSVCDYYINHRKEFELEVEAIERSLMHIPEQYRHRAAMAHWACRKATEYGGISIYAHPCWRPDRYNVSADLNEMLFREKMFDAFELVGGGRTYSQQSAIWQEEKEKGNQLPVVGSSDSHNHDYATDRDFAHHFSIVFAKEHTTESILEAVKNGYSLAAELPKGDESDIRFYGGNLRMTLFAHFLWGNYFNETWRLCIGEGILMRRYAEGETVGDLLAALAPTVENYYKKFYGLAPAPEITAERKDFLDQCLNAQRESGLITKGSCLHIYGGNENRE